MGASLRDPATHERSQSTLSPPTVSVPSAADYRHIVARWKGREGLLEAFCNAHPTAGSGCVSTTRLGAEYPRRYWPRLAKRNVMIDSVTSLYATKREAVAAASKYRQRCRLIRAAMTFFEELDAASGMSAFGQDPEEGLEAKPASPTAEGGDAQPQSDASQTRDQ